MKMSKLCLFLVPALLLACASAPPAVETVEEEPPIELIVIDEPEQATDGRPVGTYSVAQDVHDQTLLDVQAFIENLNRTIRRKDFAGWRNACTEEWFSTVSSRPFLNWAYDSSSILQGKMQRLRDVEAYFTEVVVPSRSNSRVDEISFESEDRVKAWYLHSNKDGSRWLILYDLIRIDGEWKISKSVNNYNG